MWQMKKTFILVLATISILLFTYGSYLHSQFIWLPVESDIALETGKTFRVSFTAETDMVHSLRLRTERSSLDFQEQQCRLKLIKDKSKCVGVNSPLSLRWRILEGDELFAQGETSKPEINASYSTTTVEKSLQSFQAKENAFYEIEITVLKGDPELDKTNPTLTVTLLHPNYLRGSKCKLWAYWILLFVLILYFSKRKRR